MAFENLSERERLILHNLVNYYISSADPVGSRAIATRYKMGISSATIRNTLQDLEDLGLVSQPHTSAGRIPTDLGYRVYVDSLLKPDELTEGQKKAINSVVRQEGRDINEILGQTCKVLGEISRQLGVSIAPRFEEGVLRRLELIPISAEKIMIIVVVRSGLARTVIIEVEAKLSETQLRDIESLLNERLVGLSLGEIQSTLKERLADVAGEGRLINLIIDSNDKIWRSDRSEGVHVSGVENLLVQPEFAKMEDLSHLVKLLEDGGKLKEFLNSVEDEGLVVTIGRENKFSEVMKCSLVTSSYRVGNITGTIGIVGPTRMAYSQLVSMVQYAARTLTDALSGIGTSKDR